jgi:hypothetical protein
MIDKLQRWVASGGSVRVARASDSGADVELCTCTGELMERLSSVDLSVLQELSRRGVALGAEERSRANDAEARERQV